MATERLYYRDPFLRTFSAQVIARLEIDGQPAVILDRTCFYPTSGGQPHDTGTLSGVAVLDVRERGQEVVHLLAADLDEDTVSGEIDWPRRFDHMQQHTGQHILSQAFLQLLGAETVSFHLGTDSSTIDLNRTGLSPRDLEQAEDRANTIVFEDRPVTARFVSLEELAQLPLRKPPTPHDQIRIVQIEGYDWSPCGGTHCTHTGQVGPIRITGVEHRRDQTRITFLCGWRALRDARWKDRLLKEIARPFSVGLPDLAQTIQRLVDAEEEARKALKRARRALLHYEAAERYEQGEQIGPARVVTAVLEGRPLEEVRALAREIAALPGGVALLGVRGEAGRLCFARNDGLPWDMGALVRQAAAVIGGRGGGRPHEAQGGGPDVARLEEALGLALEVLRTACP